MYYYYCTVFVMDDKSFCGRTLHQRHLFQRRVFCAINVVGNIKLVFTLSVPIINRRTAASTKIRQMEQLLGRSRPMFSQSLLNLLNNRSFIGQVPSLSILVNEPKPQ